MKQLILMRHAKSSWGNQSLPDFARPLSKRGIKEAEEIGIELSKRWVGPYLIVCSRSLRTLVTANILIDALKTNSRVNCTLKAEPNLYNATAETILETASQLPEEYTCAMLVGHNPGMSELTARLIGDWNMPEMKTANAACIRFDVDSWSLLVPGNGVLEWALSPEGRPN